MGKKCWKCNQKIRFLESYNRFFYLNNRAQIFLHTDCYFDLTKNEKKQIQYAESSPPSGLRNTLKLKGVLIAGGLGVLPYSRGYYKGAMWMTKRTLKKHDISFEKLDNICIDRYDYHYVLLPEKIQQKILEQIRNKEFLQD